MKYNQSKLSITEDQKNTEFLNWTTQQQHAYIEHINQGNEILKKILEQADPTTLAEILKKYEIK